MKKFQTFLFLIIITVSGCKNEVKIYEATPENLHLGSKIYASSEFNCKNCHGIDYKGNTSEAKELKEKGIPVTDFTGPIPPEKTPLDYFKVISVGTNRTLDGDYNYHAYYNLTDSAKWALANFLYSLGQEPKTKEEIQKRKQALQSAIQEIESIYKNNRKWYLGENTPSQQREKSRPLQEMLQNTNFKLAQEYPYKILNEQKIQKILEIQNQYIEGSLIYVNNCQSCHGIGGEGVQGAANINVLDESRYEPIKNISRRKSAFVSISSLSIDSIKLEAIQKVHPDYYFTESQWNDLIQYLKIILEK